MDFSVFVSMCKSHMSLLTIAVKFSFFADKVLLCSVMSVCMCVCVVVVCPVAFPFLLRLTVLQHLISLLLDLK